MFRIKICGITNLDDAHQAAVAGADAIGLNFFEGSPRHCELEAARKIAGELPSGVCRVGVFVNAPVERVRDVATSLRLDLVQLHGDEPPEAIAQLRGLAVMRAFRPEGEFGLVDEYLKRCHAMRAMPRMVLVDACVPGAYGGTGQVADWAMLAQSRAHWSGLPMVLAGGLKPSNVAEAINTVRPWGVDVAGGVESKPGRKSAELVREFVSTARQAFHCLSSRRC